MQSDSRVDILPLRLNDYEKIVFFTGAGMSEESGIPTYRGKGGTWKQYNYKNYACQSAFEQNPEDVLDFHGIHYQFPNVGIGFSSFQPTGVPVLFACHLGANRPEQFDRAARLGNGFITISENPNSFREIYSHVKTSAFKHKRDFSSMEKAMYMTINLNDDSKVAEKESDQFLKAYYGINMWGKLWGPWGPSKLIIRRMEEFVEAGASTLIVRFASFNVEAQLAKFLREIWPHFR